MLNLLFIGDIFGIIGRRCIEKYLPIIKKDLNINFVIANNENATHGSGCSLQNYKFLMENGVNCCTSGNHFLGRKDVLSTPSLFENQIRPLNYPTKYPCVGSKVFNFNSYKIRVTNLIGNAFIQGPQNNAFSEFDRLINDKSYEKCDFHLVDFHGEATGEKRAFAEKYYKEFDVFVGTHTHVQTNDLQLLHDKSLFISDVGCTGAVDSVLGCDTDAMISRTELGYIMNMNFIERGKCNFCAMFVQFDLDKKSIISKKLIQEVVEI